MRNRFNIIFLTVVCFLAGPTNIKSVSAKHNDISIFDFPESINSKYTKLENTSDNNYKLYLNSKDLNQDLLRSQIQLRFLLNARSLVASKHYPTSISLKVYSVSNEQKRLLKIVTPTIFTDSHAGFLKIKTTLDDIDSSSALIVDLYDTDNEFVSSFKLDVNLLNSNEVTFLELTNSGCGSDFGECQLKYFFDNVKFSTSPSKDLKTEVIKAADGSYKVNLPLFRSKTINIANNNPRDKSISNSLYLKDSGNNVAKIAWDSSLNAIAFIFENVQKNIFRISQSGIINIGTEDTDAFLSIRGGDSNVASLKLGSGALTANPINGALEYDGEKLYFSTNNTRSELILNSGQDLRGPQGPLGPPGPAGSFSGGSAQISGTLTFTATGNVQDLQANGLTIFNELAVFDEEVSQTGSGAVIVDWNNGNKQKITLTGNTTLSFVDPVSGVTTLVLRLVQDATGNRIITWPASIKWAGGIAATLSTGANTVDILSCYYVSSEYFCKAGLDFQ